MSGLFIAAKRVEHDGSRRFVAAVVTVIDGRVKAKADPRIGADSTNASLELAVTVAAARQGRVLEQQRRDGAS